MNDINIDNINKSTNHISNINLKRIIYESFLSNSKIFVSMLSLFIAYWLQDIVFPDTFANFTSDVPKFIKKISVSSVFGLIFPYLVAELLFYINNIIVADVIPNIELTVVEKVTEQTLESLKTSKTGFNTNEYIMNLKKLIESKALYYLVVSYIVPTILVGVGMIYYFMMADFKSGVLSILIMMIFMWITLTYELNTVNSSYENEDEINLFYDKIQDVISNYDTVVTSNEIINELEKLKQNKNNVKETYTNTELISTESTFSLHITSLLCAVILSGLSIKLYIDKKISKESLVFTTTTSILFMHYYNSTITRFKNTSGHIGKFYEVTDYFSKFKIIQNPINTVFKLNYGSIKFDNVSLKHGNRTIIKNFNYILDGNQTVGIIGKVGTGKTSILKMLAGLVNYDGDIYIDQQNIKTCDQDSVLKHVAYIPQHPRMFNSTIKYNLTYGLNVDDDTLNSFLNKFGFLEFFDQFEGGLNMSVGKEGVKLSGGQKQIIVLLRAIFKNKKIILLDEPTSSLDPDTKIMVLDLIGKLKNKTVLIVSHDKDVYKLFDKVIQF